MTELSDTIKVKVRFSEVDALGMVWHGNYVQYLEDARESFGRRYGLGYMDIYSEGYVVPVFDMHIRYQHPSTVNDELLVTIKWRDCYGAKLIFDYEIRNKISGELVVTAETVQLFTSLTGELEVSPPAFYEEWKRLHSINSDKEV